MKVRIKKVHPDAVIPRCAHATDAGLDLTCTMVKEDEYGNLVYHTGIAVEIPEGYVGLIFPRSSNSKKDLILTNCVGVIDSGYRGEILAKFKKLVKPTDFVYSVGERIAQMIIMPYPHIEFEEVEELSDSERGEGGYGSTGK